jgi:hypothetical protein
MLHPSAHTPTRPQNLIRRQLFLFTYRLPSLHPSHYVHCALQCQDCATRHCCMCSYWHSKLSCDYLSRQLLRRKAPDPAIIQIGAPQSIDSLWAQPPIRRPIAYYAINRELGIITLKSPFLKLISANTDSLHQADLLRLQVSARLRRQTT